MPVGAGYSGIPDHEHRGKLRLFEDVFSLGHSFPITPAEASVQAMDRLGWSV